MTNENTVMINKMASRVKQAWTDAQIRMSDAITLMETVREPELPNQLDNGLREIESMLNENPNNRICDWAVRSLHANTQSLMFTLMKHASERLTSGLSEEMINECTVVARITASASQFSPDAKAAYYDIMSFCRPDEELPFCNPHCAVKLGYGNEVTFSIGTRINETTALVYEMVAPIPEKIVLHLASKGYAQKEAPYTAGGGYSIVCPTNNAA